MEKSQVVSNKSDEVNLKKIVAEAVQEALSDPDFGLELSEFAREKLDQISKNKNVKTTPLSEIRKKYY